MNNKPIPVVAYFNLQQVKALHLLPENLDKDSILPGIYANNIINLEAEPLHCMECFIKFRSIRECAKFFNMSSGYLTNSFNNNIRWGDKKDTVLAHGVLIFKNTDFNSKLDWLELHYGYHIYDYKEWRFERRNGLRSEKDMHLSYEDILMLDKIRRERKGSC